MRIVKQIFYGIFYLTVFAGIFYLLYLAFRSPAGCTNGRRDSGEEGPDCGGACANICLPSTFEQISPSASVDIFRATTDKAIILLKIRNSNQDISAEGFDYRFDIKNSHGEKIASLGGSSFAYAGELKYLIGLFQDKNADQAVSAEFVLGNVRWAKRENFPRPSVDFLDRRTGKTETGVMASGKITNRDVVNLAKVEVIAVFKNSYGSPVGASWTELENVGPDETREFSVTHPAIADLDPNRTEYTFSALRMVSR